MPNYAMGLDDLNQSYDTYDAVDAVSDTASILEKHHILERSSGEKRCNLSKLKCPPSLAKEMRARKASSRSNRHQRAVQAEEQGEESSACITEKSFGLASASAQSLVHTLANPCQPNFTMTSSERKSSERPRLPRTPPTSSSSSESDDDTQETTEEDSSLVHASTFKNRISEDNGSRLFSSQRAPLPNGHDLVVLVGGEQYLLTSTSTGCSAERLRTESHHATVDIDLSAHSPLEWNLVLESLRPSKQHRERVGWQKLPVVLPWFIELRSLALTSEVDMFLLYNVLGGRSDGTQRTISLSNLLKLSKIAYSCGLETTKMQVRRFLRQGLLHPRKQTNSVSIVSEQEEFELDWTLEDLKVLAELMTSFDEFRDYLWEYAVITFLPHDLDISDAKSLVSNPLFPYLLREGMMQMMIMESMEATSVSDSVNKKTNKSFSDATTASDITIPTSPAKKLSQKEIERHLTRIIHHFEKFQVEKEANLSQSFSDESSTIVERKRVSVLRTKGRRTSKSSSSHERFAC
jgi:hypothetical protein